MYGERIGPADGVTYVISPKGVRAATVAAKGSRMAVTVDGVEGPVFDQILSPDGTPYMALEESQSRQSDLKGKFCRN